MTILCYPWGTWGIRNFLFLNTCIFIKGAVSRQVQCILFNFANYSPSIAMEVKVSKEITCN